MPIRDHFRPPVSDHMQWQTLAAGWLNQIADRLCEVLPDEYRVVVSVKPPTAVGVDVVSEPGAEVSPWRSAW